MTFLLALYASADGIAADRVKIIVGSQDAAFPQVVMASNVLDGAPYDVEWAVLPGPAAQLAALYSKATDLGMMGDTSLVIEQGHAKADWVADNAPLQIVAGWRNPDKVNYPAAVTVVRNDANIATLADLRGKKWANNFGGYNYAQFLLSRRPEGERNPVRPARRHQCHRRRLQLRPRRGLFRRAVAGQGSHRQGQGAYHPDQRSARDPGPVRVRRAAGRDPRPGQEQGSLRFPRPGSEAVGLV
jgi:hypothetical protein